MCTASTATAPPLDVDVSLTFIYTFYRLFSSKTFKAHCHDESNFKMNSAALRQHIFHLCETIGVQGLQRPRQLGGDRVRKDLVTGTRTPNLRGQMSLVGIEKQQGLEPGVNHAQSLGDQSDDLEHAGCRHSGGRRPP